MNTKIICTCCGKDITAQFQKTYPDGLCQACYNYFRRGGEIHPLPPKGEVHLCKKGNVICHICGKSYRALGTHIVQTHNMTRRKYSEKYGLDLGKGLCHAEVKSILRNHNKKNRRVVVQDNLIEKGIATRFMPGCEGRTKDKMSLQTLYRLKNRK